MSLESPRVLHFFKTYYPDSFGGIEQVIFQLCKGTARYGYTSEVLTLSPNAHEAPIEFSGHLVHQAQLDLQVASTGFSLFRCLLSVSSPHLPSKLTSFTCTTRGRSWI